MISVADKVASSDAIIDPASDTVFLSIVLSDRDVVRVLEEVLPDDRVDFALRRMKNGVPDDRDARRVGRTDCVDKEFERLKTAIEHRFESLCGELERALESAVAWGSAACMASIPRRWKGPAFTA